MAAPDIHNEIIDPPKSSHYDDPNAYRYQYAMWQRSGGLLPAVVNLRGLQASVAELNTMVGIKTNVQVQAQIDSKANSADLGTLSTQNSNNVNISGGNITGVNISSSNITVNAGISSDTVLIGGALYVDYVSHGNALAVETTLSNYLIKANTLNENGSFLDVVAWGDYAANGNNKQIRLKFGTTILYDTGVIAANSGSWLIKSNIVRINSASEQIISSILSSNILVLPNINATTPGEDTGIDNLLYITGTGIANNDIVQKGFIIKWYK